MSKDTTDQKPVRRSVYILPNLFTLGSVLAAFLGLIMAHKGQFNSCAIAILVSAVLDGMDGKIARLTHSASDFGVQLDSLADVIAFGVTPAYMVYFWQLQELDRIGLAVSFFFIACGAMRLARFNVMAASGGSGGSKKFFVGLPIPAAACALSCLVLFNEFLPRHIQPFLVWFTLALTFVLAGLMVSRIRYFAFKEFGSLRIKPFNLMILAVLFFALVLIEPKVFGFSFFIGYLLSGPIYTYFVFKPRVAREKISAAEQAEAGKENGSAPAKDTDSDDEQNSDF